MSSRTAIRNSYNFKCSRVCLAQMCTKSMAHFDLNNNKNSNWTGKLQRNCSTFKTFVLLLQCHVNFWHFKYHTLVQWLWIHTHVPRPFIGRDVSVRIQYTAHKQRGEQCDDLALCIDNELKDHCIALRRKFKNKLPKIECIRKTNRSIDNWKYTYIIR